MKQLINKLAIRCIAIGIVEEEDLEWFVYGVEKRVTSAIASVLFLLVAVVLSDVPTAIIYLTSFYFLRSRTNGYHAKTMTRCLFVSVIIELFFLLCILPNLTNNNVYLLNTISFLIIFIFAPYNHPNMHLSPSEERICQISSRIRITLLTASAFVFCMLGKEWGYAGITLGNTMVAFLLLIAKRNKGEENNEERKT